MRPTTVGHREVAIACLIRHFHRKEAGLLLQALPQHEGQQIIQSYETQASPFQWMDSIEQVIDHVHYSWIDPLIAKASPARQTAWDLVKEDGSIALKQTLYTWLYQQLNFADVLPIALLPESPLNELLDFKKRDLVHLIGSLGMFDLAAALRRTVTPAHQSKARQLLATEQLKLLDIALRQQDLLPAPNADFAQLTRDQRTLNHFIQLYGIARLAKTLSSEHSALTWHLAHRLDRGRGKSLLQYSAEPCGAELGPRLHDQLNRMVTQFKEARS